MASTFGVVGRTADSFVTWMRRVAAEAQIDSDATDAQFVAAIFTQLAAGDLAANQEDDPDDGYPEPEARPRMR